MSSIEFFFLFSFAFVFEKIVKMSSTNINKYLKIRCCDICHSCLCLNININHRRRLRNPWHPSPHKRSDDVFVVYYLFFNSGSFLFLLPVTSQVWVAPWTRITARPTPLRRTHPSCPTALHPVTVALASCLHPPPRVFPPPPHVRHAPHAHLGAPPVSRAHSSMRTPTCTHQRPPPPPADHWTQ